MAIAETQLETWAKQGSVTQSADTYAPIKKVLEAANTPYPVAHTDCYLQGSYGNDTNVRAESDVDIVMQYKLAIHFDVSRLSPEDLARYKSQAIGTASYGYFEFKRDVLGVLQSKFSGVTAGKKAVAVPANSGRRDADVLVSVVHRRYYTFPLLQAPLSVDGVVFYSDGRWIENFPKQHSQNCTLKHQGTRSMFKPTVRIFKNMRNRLRAEGRLADGVAPSYFIEGLLFNVPPANFKSTYVDTFVSCFNWIANADTRALVCASGLHPLIADDTPTSWPLSNFRTFVAEMRDAWNRG